MTEEPQPTKAVEVFFSYAHEDGDMRRGLEQHFSFLRREGKTVHWHDGEIMPGGDWRGEIEEHLNSADVILLLISAAFADSDFCYSVELTRALERHKAGEAVVIPIRLHPCDWQQAPFAQLQALPGGDAAISECSNLQKAFYEVAKGVREVVEGILAKRPAPSRTAPTGQTAATSARILPPPAIDFVSRKDREGRDIVERLRQWLTQRPARLTVLWGEGGVGKTTIAAEVARSLTADFNERIVWASAEKRADFTFPILLNDIADQLGHPDLAKLATEPKEQAVRRLLTAAPALVILDNFETVSPDEKAPCADFLARRTHCPALITTRERVAHDAARHVHVEAMGDDEARQFVERWINQEAHDPRAFAGLDRDEIIRAAAARPYVLQWVLAQIDLAMEPRAVLDELTQAEGEVGERVFQRSFDLPQLGDDGRAALLALSLFTPSASRPALAEVAGFGDDLGRLNEAVKRLAALRLVQTTPGGHRLVTEGLTKSLTQSYLSNDERAGEFRRRYCTYFLRYAEAHQQGTPEHLDALGTEKDNILSVMDAAFRARDWDSVIHISAALARFLHLRGHWDEAVKRAEQAEAAALELKNDAQVAGFKADAGMIRWRRGDYGEARRLCEDALGISERLGGRKSIAICLHRLGMIAKAQGDLEEARRLCEESLAISKELNDHHYIGLTVWGLGNIALQQRNFEEAEALLNESLNIFTDLKDQANTAGVLNQLAQVAKARGNVSEARRLYGESLKMANALGHQNVIAGALRNLALLAEGQGDKKEAARLFRESLPIYETLGSPEAGKVRRDLVRVEGKPD